MKGHNYNLKVSKVKKDKFDDSMEKVDKTYHGFIKEKMKRR